MIANMLVVAFILLLAFFFSTQGLFSAILHLVVTVLAGAVALALWEPLTYGYLLGRMPEMAWGVGLLAPFVLTLLLLRMATDKLVGGNVHFPSLIDQILGGAVGFVSATLTAGLMVIGLNYIAPFSIGSFQRYELDPAGELVVKDSLWIPADTIAGSAFTMLSGGSLSPAFSAVSLPRHMPQIARASAVFGLTSRDGARATMMPRNVEVARAFEAPADTLPAAAKAARPAGGQRLIVITTRHNLEGVKDLPPDPDPDSHFTATAAQVTLLAGKADGPSEPITPVGWVFRDAFGSFAADGFARTRANPVEETFDWIFHLPAGLDPRFIRIKQVRLPLPDADTTDQAAAQWVQSIQWTKPDQPDADGGEPDNGGATQQMVETDNAGAGTRGFTVSVTADLPTSLSKNWISEQIGGRPWNDNNQLTPVQGVVEFRDAHGVNENLRISQVQYTATTSVVRVAVNHQNARSLLGRARELARTLEPPRLITDTGRDQYAPIGYVIANRNRMILHFTGRRLQSMREIELKETGDGDTLYLYFLANPGDRLTTFRISGKGHAIDIGVPE